MELFAFKIVKGNDLRTDEGAKSLWILPAACGAFVPFCESSTRGTRPRRRSEGISLSNRNIRDQAIPDRLAERLFPRETCPFLVVHLRDVLFNLRGR